MLRVNLGILMGYEVYRLEDFIKLRKDNIKELHKIFYERMRISLRVGLFPSDLVKETDKTVFVYSFLEIVVDFIYRKFGLTEKKIVIMKEVPFSIVLGERLRKIIADYSVVASESESSLVVVECKTASCDEAVKQCVAYLTAMFKGQTVYGICTNTRRYRFITYNPDLKEPRRYEGFKISRDFTLIFPDMFNLEELWLAEKTQAIDILYTILTDQLELPPLSSI